MMQGVSIRPIVAVDFQSKLHPDPNGGVEATKKREQGGQGADIKDMGAGRGRPDEAKRRVGLRST